MRTPREIYAAYKIMPSLQLHQLRVAAVGKLICENFKQPSVERGRTEASRSQILSNANVPNVQPINTSDVILECLFHDMGNIVKFDLAYFPEFVQPEGQAYWESVKADFTQKYGREQHAANAAIAREIGLSTEVIDIMNAGGFSRIGDIVESGSLELKVCQYADLRVAPHGVVSLEERLQDFSRRYAKKNDSADEHILHASRELERQIFADATIKPEDITDAAVAPLIEELSQHTVA